MHDQHQSDLERTIRQDHDKTLWKALGEVPATQGTPQARAKFYARLHRIQTNKARLRYVLQAAAMVACVAVGFGLGNRPDNNANVGTELASIQLQMQSIRQDLALTLLSHPDTKQRLRGVQTASFEPGNPRIQSALLERALEDRSASVRLAAVDTLSAGAAEPQFGETVLQALQQTEDPLAQRALVELILRKGSGADIEQLLALSRSNRLHRDVARWVQQIVVRSQA